MLRRVVHRNGNMAIVDTVILKSIIFRRYINRVMMRRYSSSFVIPIRTMVILVLRTTFRFRVKRPKWTLHTVPFSLNALRIAFTVISVNDFLAMNAFQ